MKKYICLLLALSICFAIAACGSQSNTETTGSSQETIKATEATDSTGSTSSTENSNPPTEPTGESQPVISVPQIPMVSISLPTVTETLTADDGTVLFRYQFQDVMLNITDPDIAEIVTLNLLQHMDSNSQTVSDLAEQAIGAYKPGSQWTPYGYEISYLPTRVDELVLSLRGSHSSTADSAYPTTSITSANYDLVTGKLLHLGDILTEENTAVTKLTNALIKQLDAIATSKNLYSDYAQTIQARFKSDLNQFNAWYFTKTGLSFYFSPYDIAPNASGTIEVTVPFTELTNVLRDAYFPTEQATIDGKLSAQWFNSADTETITHFAELITHPDAERVLLTTDTILYDLTIEQGHWDIASNRFVADATVFTASCLAQGDALVLRAELPDSTPALRVQFTANGIPQNYYITQNHSTNAIILSPAK